MADRHFAVTLKRSAHHWPETQQKTLRSLGLTRFGKTIYLKDTPAIRGMLYKVVHAVAVDSHEGPPPPSGRQKGRGAASSARDNEPQELGAESAGELSAER
jgi:large subunit ribosomal protein L30